MTAFLAPFPPRRIRHSSDCGAFRGSRSLSSQPIASPMPGALHSCDGFRGRGLHGGIRYRCRFRVKPFRLEPVGSISRCVPTCDPLSKAWEVSSLPVAPLQALKPYQTTAPPLSIYRNRKIRSTVFNRTTQLHTEGLSKWQRHWKRRGRRSRRRGAAPSTRSTKTAATPSDYTEPRSAMSASRNWPQRSGNMTSLSVRIPVVTLRLHSLADM